MDRINEFPHKKQANERNHNEYQPLDVNDKTPVNQIVMPYDQIKAYDMDTNLTLELKRENETATDVNDIAFFILANSKDEYSNVENYSVENGVVNFTMPKVDTGKYTPQIMDKQGRVYSSNDNQFIDVVYNRESRVNELFPMIKHEVIEKVIPVLKQYMGDNVIMFKGDKGDDGKDFKFEDYTPEQLESLRGERGPKGYTGDRGPKGDPLNFDELTPEQKLELKGEKGDQGIQGEKGEIGEPLTFNDLTPEQISMIEGVSAEVGFKNLFNMSTFESYTQNLHTVDYKNATVNFSNSAYTFYTPFNANHEGLYTFSIGEVINPNYTGRENKIRVIVRTLETETIVIPAVDLSSYEKFSFELTQSQIESATSQFEIGIQVSGASRITGSFSKPMLVFGNMIAEHVLSELDSDYVHVGNFSGIINNFEYNAGYGSSAHHIKTISFKENTESFNVETGEFSLKPGYWLINATIRPNVFTERSGIIHVAIRKNNAHVVVAVKNDDDRQSITLNEVVKVNEGDKITLSIWSQYSFGSKPDSTLNLIDTTPEYNTITGKLLGVK